MYFPAQFLEFSFNPRCKIQWLSELGQGVEIFKKALYLRDRHIIFYVKITGYFERFQCFNYEKSFLKSKKKRKTGVPLKYYCWQHNISIQNWPAKKILRQIEWGVQNGPITENAVLPLTPQFFWNFYFSLGISYK